MASAPASAATAAVHHDTARAAVPTTAISTCSLRALESLKPAGERLFSDPCATLLCGEDALSGEQQSKWIQATSQSLDFWVDFLATRTRWIDDMVTMARPEQLVILGAGLDSRAYRLEILRGASVYEVDFAEVLEAKAALLAEQVPLAQFRPLHGNLGAEEEAWVQILMTAGFKPGQKSTWLLEGLTGYLTEVELGRLFKRVATLAAPGSRLIATFVGKEANKTSMHRYVVADEVQVASLLSTFGWVGAEVFSSSAVARLYGRTSHIPEEYPYFLSASSRGETSHAHGHEGDANDDDEGAAEKKRKKGRGAATADMDDLADQ